MGLQFKIRGRMTVQTQDHIVTNFGALLMKNNMSQTQQAKTTFLEGFLHQELSGLPCACQAELEAFLDLVIERKQSTSPI